jgi:hypothetical protein
VSIASGRARCAGRRAPASGAAGAHPRGQLGHGERLGHVVVGAEVQAAHPVVDRVARRENQHRHGFLGRPQAPQHLETVHLRQADVEDDEVEALLRGGEHRLLAAPSDVDRIALGLQHPSQPGSSGASSFHDQQRMDRDDTAALAYFSREPL